MSDKEINVAIAECCGWVYHEATSETEDVDGYVNGDQWKHVEDLPNYCNDLNAMHEAEKVFDSMDYQFKNTYAGTLENILEIEVKKSDPDCYPDVYGFEWIHATARQRAEAFLKTVGKWQIPPSNP